MIKIELLNQKNQAIRGKIDHEKEEADFIATGNQLCVLGIKDYRYQLGDKIRVNVDYLEQAYYMVQLDETLVPSLVYFTQDEWIFELPLAENLIKSSVETAFSSNRHSIMVRKAHDFEIENYQNLSFNAHDQKENSDVYPHAFANVETRDDSVFFAKNAIDGKYANLSHGSYPFASWGINQQKDAALTIDFGREVEIDKIALLLRCDFPHDSFWEQIRVSFSDGEYFVFDTERKVEFQTFEFEARLTSTVTLSHLKKVADDSPFPALTQIEVFGKNKIGKR